MVKTAIGFNVARQRWVQWLTTGRNPVQDCPLQALGIVRPCIGRTSLYLSPSQPPGLESEPPRTSSPMCTTSSSEPSIKRSSSPGTICKSCWKTRCSRRSLPISVSKIHTKRERRSAHSCVNDSSATSANSPMRRMPLFRRAPTVHSAWTVRPKCLP